MAHHIYNTKCLVLGGVSVGENNRFLTLFTRDVGLVRALGKSLRGVHSKMRYHLQPYSYAAVSLVRGRDIWRLTGAQESVNLYEEFSGVREKQLLMVRTCALLSRLLQGENAEENKLFDLIENGMTFLRKNALDTELIRDFEYLFVIRILALLGYVGEHDRLNSLVSSSSFSASMLTEISVHRFEAAKVINRALEASEL